MNAEEASALAVKMGGASFSVCPVCDERFLAGPLALHEEVLRRHCEAHSAEDYLRVIARLNAKVAEVESKQRVLDAFGVTADEIESLPDSEAMRQARAERVRFEAELPGRVEQVEKMLNARLPDGLRVQYR